MNENQSAGTVTIDREVYEILVAAYKAHDAAMRASWARGDVPMLTDSQVAELDKH